MYGKARILAEKSAVDTRTAFERAADSLENTFTKLSDGIENTLADALMGTRSWGDAMRSIFREVLRDQIKARIIKPFVNSLFGGSSASIPSIGSSSTAVTFNIQANDTRGFDQLLYERRSQIVGMVNQAVNENGQRAIA
jgi:hypothetical protein